MQEYINSIFTDDVSDARLGSTINKFDSFRAECSINEQEEICRSIYFALCKIRTTRKGEKTGK